MTMRKVMIVYQAVAVDAPAILLQFQKTANNPFVLLVLLHSIRHISQPTAMKINVMQNKRQ